jgi:hypothetical protein
VGLEKERDELSRFIGFLNGAGFVIRPNDGEGTESAFELINRYQGQFDESPFEDQAYDNGFEQGVEHRMLHRQPGE